MQAMTRVRKTLCVRTKAFGHKRISDTYRYLYINVPPERKKEGIIEGLAIVRNHGMKIQLRNNLLH